MKKTLAGSTEMLKPSRFSYANLVLPMSKFRPEKNIPVILGAHLPIGELCYWLSATKCLCFVATLARSLIFIIFSIFN